VRAAGASNGCLEGIEVAHDEVDGGDALFVQRRGVLRIVANGEDTGVDARVQRFHASVEDLRKAGDIGDVADGQPGCGERLARAAGGDQLDAEIGEAAGEVDQPGFFADTEQGAADN